ncbi:putative serine/threonine-protein kinase abkC [Prunus yedoensis var. nudiflora]|uniref:Putative serine/threonine-protein kinase abkC n=1 Tax=Prunus yedoensis var. nudiflora TaxID=2094558 RepID=A0A314XTV0_PRUYE|nr:putative serine/threonine-protein kinase abkC [Prunus yedoensis var. nudiflora]
MQFLNDIMNPGSFCYKFPSSIIYIMYLILVYIWPKFLIFFFLRQVEEAYAFWGTPEGDLVHPAECMQQLLEKVRCHRDNVDGNVCTVMVTTLVLEGWQRKLDPGYNVMQTLLLKADWAKFLSYTTEGTNGSIRRSCQW